MPVQSHSPSTLTNQSTNQPVSQASKQASKQTSSIHRQLVASLPTPHFTGERRRVQSDLRRTKSNPTPCSKQSIHKQLYLYPSSCTSSVVVVVAAARPIFPMSSAVFMFSIWISTSLPTPCIPCVSSAFPPPSMAVQKLPIRRPSCKSDKSVCEGEVKTKVVCTASCVFLPLQEEQIETGYKGKVKEKKEKV